MSVSARVALQLDHAAKIRRRVHCWNRRHLIEAARFTLAVAHDLNQSVATHRGCAAANYPHHLTSAMG